MSRQQVQFYQWVMALRGHHPRDAASLDGLLGPTTTTATQSYQRSNGLPVTGRLDTATVALLNADGARLALAGQNPPSSLPAGGGASTGTRSAVTGSHPKVGAIPTASGTLVVVPDSVSKMLPPTTVAQLQTMPAPQVQSFVDDLVRKVATAENTVLSEGTGKDFTAVPVVVNGVVTAGVQQVNTALAPHGWWAGLTPNERIGYGVGGAVVGVALVGGLVYLFSGKDRR